MQFAINHPSDTEFKDLKLYKRWTANLFLF